MILDAPNLLDFAPLTWHARPLFDRPLALTADAGALFAADPGALGAYGGGEVGDERQLPYSVTGGVATIGVHGALANRESWLTRAFGVATYQGIGHALRAAASDAQVRSIALDLDSPGGEAAGAMETADLVAEIAKRKPVVAFVNSLAASGAYWIACGASEIVATPLATLGSIGVVWLHLDHSAAFAKAGVKPTLLFAGQHKVDGAETHPLATGARARIQAQLDDVYSLFTASVGKHRPRLGAAGAKATEAAVFIGARAVEAGLADRVAASPLPFRSAVAAPSPTAAIARSLVSEAPAPLPTPPNSRPPTLAPRAETPKPPVRAPDPATEDERDDKKGYDLGFAAQRARIAAIMECEEATGRPKCARYIAFKTDLSVDLAIEELRLAGPENVAMRHAPAPAVPPPPWPTYRSMAEFKAAQARLGAHGCTITGP